jgi:lipopolysaccharide transport system ATP-binding protein
MHQDPIIEIKSVGKRYNINHHRGGYVALRDVIMTIIRSPFKFLKTKAKEMAGIDTKEEFWALKNIDFDVQKGEVIGIIGRNGAGKSTLLKILSQITPPTEGEITIRGKVGSLLEVGTGFHPELSGRENIFLNGAILGMHKKEIAEKFDQIVEFSGIEKFIDTPVKYYSSGMYVRLAFSVAAHMDPDVLIVDEVLAVGDAEFQKKCLGKMNEITAKEGRTIFFVSHNMDAVSKLCTRCVLLRDGKIVMNDKTEKVVHAYLNNKENLNSSVKFRRNPNAPACLLEAVLLDDEEKMKEKFSVTEDIILQIIWENVGGVPVTPNFNLMNRAGNLVFQALDTPVDFDGEMKKEKGVYASRFVIPKNLLNEGYYSINIALDNPMICYDLRTNILGFTAYDMMDEKSIARGVFKKNWDNLSILPALKCSFKKLS